MMSMGGKGKKNPKKRAQDSDDGDDDQKKGARPAKWQAGTGRFRRPTKDGWALTANGHAPVYILKLDRRAGSASVAAVLGPASLAERANDANPNLPTGIAAARRTYPRSVFKAGHMLNCDLGGDGNDPGNLTILTASANTAMTRYDNALKQAVRSLDALYEQLRMTAPSFEILNLWARSNCAIRAVIATVGQWGADEPDCFIAQRVTVAATVVNERNLELGRLGAAQLGEAPFRSLQLALADVRHHARRACGSVPNG